MAEIATLAPEYRYYTVDLLGNYVLAEIPFEGVSWERALKSAGAFEGKIPVIPETKHLDLYDSTMPGKTALFVVRNDICVWGGIIWSREYDVVSHELSVDASEFTSYFYHRKIWKTWNHEFGATVTINTGAAGTVVFDYGSTTTVLPGSTVEIEFYDPSDFQYNGYYRVSNTPAPSLSGFSIVGGTSIADIATVEVTNGTAYITTAANHGFNTGDLITVTSSYGSPFNGTFEITVPAGSDSNLFTFPVTGSDIIRTVDTGNAVRPIPAGVYLEATVTVRSDTYDYVRALINSVFADFVGIDFPNVYIEPGISYALDITSKQLAGGYATITTNGDHNLAVGQAVQIKDVGPAFDGEFEVLQTPASNIFMYAAGGTLAATSVAPVTSTITAMSMANFSATITTQTAHNYIVGNTVTVFVGYDYPDFNGDQIVTSVPSPTTFTFDVLTNNSVAQKTLVNAQAVVGASAHTVISSNITSNLVTLTTADDHNFTAGSTVTVSNVNRSVFLSEKALDAPNSVATLRTAIPHHFQSGSSVTVEGLSDVSVLTNLSSTTAAATFTTQQAHNFAVGQTVTIDALIDNYYPGAKLIASNVATLGFPVSHNMAVGTSVTVSGLVDIYAITNKMLSSNVATITTSAAHNAVVNDTITVVGLTDSGTVVSLTAENDIATLTLSAPHNFLEDQKITVSGVGAPFDGDFTVLAVSETRVLYEIDNGNALILPAVSGGTVTSTDSFFNGDYTISAVTSNTISYIRGGQNIVYQSDSGLVEYDSVMNGVWTISAVSATSISWPLIANNASITGVPVAASDDDVQATAAQVSIFTGPHVLTGITRNTITFAQVITNAIAPLAVAGNVSAQSIFNGTRAISSVPASDLFKETLAATSNVLEEASTNLATATSTTIFNGTYVITAVSPTTRQFSYARTWQNIEETSVLGYGLAAVYPVAVVSSFGPYPGNANIGMGFSTRQYSGVNVTPVAYRGFELKTVGEALDAYSDSLDGFEYRIDCSYDLETKSFTKTFVLLPINFPDPPPAGQVSPLSRFGADKLVFEYPGGSITAMSIQESAEDSATRFFASGATDSGPDTGPNISIASAEELLSGTNGTINFRPWPLLDDTEQVDDVDDETVLYAYAQRYLSENRPPDASLTIDVNGSLSPIVGTYAPGDWCALIVKDDFVMARLASALEPRDDVIVRKIDGFKVSVPDGTTFPEKVSLTLVPEWEVDQVGKPSI